MHVLLAEDNAINREIASYFLNELNCVVISVENGANAVKAYQEQSFDLVLMDVQMPVLNGLDAARAIRELEQKLSRRVPILAVTAYTMPREVELFIAAGMDDHVSKPLTLDKLRAAIAKWGLS